MTLVFSFSLSPSHSYILFFLLSLFLSFSCSLSSFFVGERTDNPAILTRGWCIYQKWSTSISTGVLDLLTYDPSLAYPAQFWPTGTKGGRALVPQKIYPAGTSLRGTKFFFSIFIFLQ